MKLPATLEFPVLFKILRNEYVDDLLDGHLYMNNLKYYVDLEKNTGVRGVGDIREASLVNIHRHELFVQYDDGEKIKLDPEPPPGIIYDEEALYHPVFCTVGNVFTLEYIGHNQYAGKISLPKEALKDFTDIDNESYKVVVIFNVIDFLSKIQDKNVMGKADFVTYRDMRLPNIIDGKWYLDNTFIKDLRFKNQSEYRIELFFHSEDAYVLDIGDIRELSFVIDCNDIVSGVSVIQTIKSNE